MGTWLHRIATNECLMMQRRKQPGSLDEMMESDRAAEAHARSGTSRAPEELALVSETQGEVLSALERLPENQRNAVMLVDGCGMTYADAAEALGTTAAAVRSTLFRARRTLREDLAEIERT